MCLWWGAFCSVSSPLPPLTRCLRPLLLGVSQVECVLRCSAAMPWPMQGTVEAIMAQEGRAKVVAGKTSWGEGVSEKHQVLLGPSRSRGDETKVDGEQSGSTSEGGMQPPAPEPMVKWYMVERAGSTSGTDGGGNYRGALCTLLQSIHSAQGLFAICWSALIPLL